MHVVEQLADELVLAEFVPGPPVPEHVLHGLSNVGGGVLEDDLVALAAERAAALGGPHQRPGPAAFSASRPRAHMAGGDPA